MRGVHPEIDLFSRPTPCLIGFRLSFLFLFGERPRVCWMYFFPCEAGIRKEATYPRLWFFPPFFSPVFSVLSDLLGLSVPRSALLALRHPPSFLGRQAEVGVRSLGGGGALSGPISVGSVTSHCCTVFPFPFATLCRLSTWCGECWSFLESFCFGRSSLRNKFFFDVVWTLCRVPCASLGFFSFPTYPFNVYRGCVPRGVDARKLVLVRSSRTPYYLPNVLLSSPCFHFSPQILRRRPWPFWFCGAPLPTAALPARSPWTPFLVMLAFLFQEHLFLFTEHFRFIPTLPVR